MIFLEDAELYAPYDKCRECADLGLEVQDCTTDCPFSPDGNGIDDDD